MQTFLPYKSFSHSAKVLDNKRLGKQRVEALQILKINSFGIKGDRWYNHPIVKMWRGYEESLADYGICICEEWLKRGFVDNLLKEFEIFIPVYKTGSRIFNAISIIEDPPWLGNRKFHLSHKSNLLRKDFLYYIDKFNYVPTDLPYQWWNPDTKKFYTIKRSK